LLRGLEKSMQQEHGVAFQSKNDARYTVAQASAAPKANPAASQIAPPVWRSQFPRVLLLVGSGNLVNAHGEKNKFLPFLDHFKLSSKFSRQRKLFA
jgi:hypothetical protein